jgi:hypothetical protein
MGTTSTKLTLQQLTKDIERHGRLAARRSTYMQRNVARFGPSRQIPASRTIAGRLAKPGEPQPRSTVVTVGEEGLPAGFGKQVLWDARDSAIAVVAFLNAGDHLGVMISGAKPTDSIKFVSATGLASYAEDTRNEGIPALIGLVAAGGSATAAAFGAPEAKPLIDSGAAFAKEMFKEEKVKTKVRDAFGVDPASGHKARQEGGVVVSLPAAGQIFYSGSSDHKERWIKEPGTRDDAHRPDHVRNAFFLRPGDRRTTSSGGDFIISAWDFAFSDNFGFYRLHVLLERGDGQLPDGGVD